MRAFRTLHLFVPCSIVLWRSAGSILPASLDCTRSAASVEVAEAATETFGCPPYFASRTCCSPGETSAVWDKVEDIVQFVLRVLNDQSQDLGDDPEMQGDECAEYYNGLFRSRSEHYREAREAAEKGLEILQGSAMHLLCAACFACAKPLKTAQVEDYMRRALLSVQDRMGAIFTKQLQADVPQDGRCSVRYVQSLSEGLIFPAWGRVVPEMDATAPDLNHTFSGWMDRVLSLLIETPGALLFQRSILGLAFYYSSRPESEAFSLLLAPELPADADAKAAQPSAAGAAVEAPDAVAAALDRCPPGPRRFFVSVPQDIAVDRLQACRQVLEQKTSAWSVRWVVTSQAHVAALRRDGAADASLLWRRFPARDLHGLVQAVCGPEPAWVAELSTQDPNCEQVAEDLRRHTSSASVGVARSRLRPSGVRPAVPLPSPRTWPSEALGVYLQAHAEFREAAKEGRRLPGSRILIYSCTPMTFCGGHGDRLNGMLGAAVVALLSGRFFFIDAQRPVPLSLVLQPVSRGLDWRLFGTHAAMPASFNWNDNLAGFESDPRRVLDNQASVLRFVSNQRVTSAALLAAPQQAEALGLSPQPKLHAELFRALFAPSAALRRRLAQRRLPEGKLIGVHFRAGDQMPKNWRDPARHSLSELDEFLDCAEKLESTLAWKARFLLFADTDRVLELPRVKQLRESGKLLWPDQADHLVHLDRSPPTLTLRGLLSTWSDWWTLAFDVHALVIAQSGFGATALEIGPPRPAMLGSGCVWAEASTG